jgi:hypothetical protein
MMFDLDKRKGEAREGQPVEGPMVVAYLAMRVALDGIAMNAKVTDTARRLCDFMLDELAYRRLKALEPQLYDWKMAHFHTSSYRHKKGSLDMTLKYADISVGDLKMSATDKLIVGIKLLDVVAECTGLIELDHGLGARLVSTRRGRMRHRALYLKPGPGIKEWIGDKNERMADMTFSLFPMVVPPVDWMPGQRGGYRFKLRQMFPMVRTGDSRVSAIAERSDLPVVFTALNTLQQTAWKSRGVCCCRNGASAPGTFSVSTPPASFSGVARAKLSPATSVQRRFSSFSPMPVSRNRGFNSDATDFAARGGGAIVPRPRLAESARAARVSALGSGPDARAGRNRSRNDIGPWIESESDEQRVKRPHARARTKSCPACG